MKSHTRISCLMVLIAAGALACSSSDGGGGTGGTGNNNSSGGSGNSSAGTGSGSSGTSNSNGGTSNGGTSNGGTSNGGSSSNSCDGTDPTGMGMDDCPGLVDCAETQCSDEYETCLGADYLDGDFTGGACADYMDCVVACDEDDCDCQEGCEMSQACSSCFTTTLGNCVANSCLNEALACAGGGEGGAGSGGAGGLGDATCADLTACCASLGDQAASCQQVAGLGQDIACSVAFTTFGCE